MVYGYMSREVTLLTRMFVLYKCTYIQIHFIWPCMYVWLMLICTCACSTYVGSVRESMQVENCFNFIPKWTKVCNVLALFTTDFLAWFVHVSAVSGAEVGVCLRISFFFNYCTQQVIKSSGFICSVHYGHVGKSLLQRIFMKLNQLSESFISQMSLYDDIVWEHFYHSFI